MVSFNCSTKKFQFYSLRYKIKYPILYIALRGRKPFRACLYKVLRFKGSNKLTHDPKNTYRKNLVKIPSFQVEYPSFENQPNNSTGVQVLGWIL